MLTPEQKKAFQRIDILTGGLAELLQWNSADGKAVTYEDAARSSCYLAIVGEIRSALFDLCPAEVAYDVDRGRSAE